MKRDEQFDGQLDSRLESLFKEYRASIPDPEPSAGFMPGLWRKIETRRTSNLTLFRRWAEVCLGAAVALALLMGAVVIPHYEKLPVYSSASYVDVLEADHPNTYVDILTGDIK
ncbi:MAG TPA: hypothetical protein VKS01_04295 [Bryobacteraceae bacterium]|nr:hypothetical protein [Bryobacteraceae bacterium]